MTTWAPSYSPQYSRKLNEAVMKGIRMTGNIDDVRAPRSMKNIVEEVAEYIQKRAANMHDFETYDDAVHAVWPELAKANSEAHLRVTISIYYELAERWGFEPTIPDVVKELKL